MSIDSSFGDPRFQPAALSDADIMAAFQALAARFAVFDPAKATWLIPIIQAADAANVPSDKTMRTLRNEHAAELAATLTDLGREDEEETLEAILLAPSRQRVLRRDLGRAAESDNPVRFSAVADRRTCEAAKVLHGSIFELGQQPAVPLADCDKLNCRCMWMNLPRRTAERQYGYVKP